MKITKPFEIEFFDGTERKYLKNENCIVDDIIGFGYNIKDTVGSNIFRMKNGEMAEYFEIINHIPYIEQIPENFDNFNLVRFKKNFNIKNIISISENQTFKHEACKTDKIFHNLYSINDKRLLLRMTDAEFMEYLH